MFATLGLGGAAGVMVAIVGGCALIPIIECSSWLLGRIDSEGCFAREGEFVYWL